jgi:voltage-gated sodium channel
VLILGGFISLSLANAIFVDEMASDNNDEIMKKMDLLMAENTEIKKVLTHLEKRIGKP